MTVFLETRDQISRFEAAVKKAVAIPVFRYPTRHYKDNECSFVYLYTPEEQYVWNYTHPDAIAIGVFDANSIDIFTPNSRAFRSITSHNKLVDLTAAEYIKTEEISSREFIPTTDIADNVAIMNLIKPLRKYASELWVGAARPSLSLYDAFVMNIVVPTLGWIESKGVYISNFDRLRQEYPTRNIHRDKNNLVYSEYNPYTRTGRPSNRYNGINFSAFSKTSGIRSTMTSRFGDAGHLLLIDFESFHVRLIAELIQYPFPKNIAIHEYFGKLYFGVEELTPEQYTESKQITFQFLYGQRVTDAPEFFQRVYEYIDILYRQYQADHKINTPMWMKPISMVESPEKLFNYLLQSYETEVNIWNLYKLRGIFEDRCCKSVPIMYTYDSVLFDMHNDETDVYDLITAVLSVEGKWPYRLWTGKNYHDMIRKQQYGSIK